MTKEELIQLAEKADALCMVSNFAPPSFDFGIEQLEYFADLIAVKAREECYAALLKVMVTDHSLRTYKRCLDAIKKLGEK